MKYMPQEWIEKAKAAYKIQQQRKQLEQQEKSALEELKALQGYESARGGGIIFMCTTRQGNVDYQAIVTERLPEIDINAYRKQSTMMWKMDLELVEQ